MKIIQTLVIFSVCATLAYAVIGGDYAVLNQELIAMMESRFTPSTSVMDKTVQLLDKMPEEFQQQSIHITQFKIYVASRTVDAPQMMLAMVLAVLDAYSNLDDMEDYLKLLQCEPLQRLIKDCPNAEIRENLVAFTNTHFSRFNYLGPRMSRLVDERLRKLRSLVEETVPPQPSRSDSWLTRLFARIMRQICTL